MAEFKMAANALGKKGNFPLHFKINLLTGVYGDIMDDIREKITWVQTCSQI